jgi:hypothetical protein
MGVTHSRRPRGVAATALGAIFESVTDLPSSFEDASVAAVLAQRSREARDELLEDLVTMLSAVVPNVQVERSLLRRRVTAIRMPVGDHAYVLKKTGRGYEPLRIQEVRGVAIRTTPMEIDAFLAELGTAIDAELHRTERGREALQRWLNSMNR